MKWESSDLTVGVVVVTASLIILASLLWLSPVVSSKTYPLYTEFDRIDGISPQANVLLRGYTVGKVGDIEPRMAGDGNLRFRVRLDIESRLARGDSLRLPQGTTARLVPPPVIGAGFIVLETPDNGGAPLPRESTIPGVRTTAIVEQVQGLTTDMGGEMLSTMGTARALMDSVTLAVAVANRTLVETAAVIPPLVRNLEAQLVATRSLTADLQTQVNSISPAALATIDSVTLLLSDSRRLVQDLQSTLATTAPDMVDIVAQLDTTSMLLSHFVRQVTLRPWKAFTGVEPPAGLEPPPPGAPIGVGSAGDTVPPLDGDSLPRPH